jgi:hypothetical protein
MPSGGAAGAEKWVSRGKALAQAISIDHGGTGGELISGPWWVARGQVVG